MGVFVSENVSYFAHMRPTESYNFENRLIICILEPPVFQKKKKKPFHVEFHPVGIFCVII